MSRFPNKTPNHWLPRSLIVALAALIVGVSGCASHPSRWGAANDPILSANADQDSEIIWFDNSQRRTGNQMVDHSRNESVIFSGRSPVTPQNSPESFANLSGLPAVRNSPVQFDDLSPVLDSPSSSVDFAGFDSRTFGATADCAQPSWFETLRSDQIQFYSRQNIRPALFTLGASAILANTRMDQEFADWYQNDVRSESLDDLAKIAKGFGEQWPMMGLYVTSSIGGRLIGEDTRLAFWGDRSIRSMLVGVPPLLLLQKAIGSSRPNDMPPSSSWDFWADDNGASGHAFVGAVPFLVAAQLTENPRQKAILVWASTWTGWSRINDNDHYLSQVIVGWWLAYAATQSVERSDACLNYQIAPIMIGDSLGLEMSWRR